MNVKQTIFVIKIYKLYKFVDKYAIRAYVENQVVQYKNQETIEQKCEGMTNANQLEIKWYTPRKQEIQSGSKFSIITTETSQAPMGKSSKLTIYGANPADSGYYECVVMVGRQKETVRFEFQHKREENSNR